MSRKWCSKRRVHLAKMETSYPTHVKCRWCDKLVAVVTEGEEIYIRKHKATNIEKCVMVERLDTMKDEANE